MPVLSIFSFACFYNNNCFFYSQYLFITYAFRLSINNSDIFKKKFNKSDVGNQFRQICRIFYSDIPIFTRKFEHNNRHSIYKKITIEIFMVWIRNFWIKNSLALATLFAKYELGTRMLFLLEFCNYSITLNGYYFSFHFYVILFVLLWMVL